MNLHVTTYTALKVCPRVKRSDGQPITREETALAILSALESLAAQEPGREAYIRLDALTEVVRYAETAWLLDVRVNDTVICQVRLVP